MYNYPTGTISTLAVLGQNQMPESYPSEQNFPTPSSWKQLFEELKKHDWTVNWRTADALAQLGAEAVPSLLQALEIQDGYMRNGAAIALGKIGSKDFVQPLLQALRWRDDRVYEDDEDIEARMSAATALGKLHDPAICEPLLAELEKILVTDRTLASHIAEALGAVGNPRAIPTLAKLVEHHDPDIQRDSSFALAELGSDAIQIMHDILNDRSRRGRGYVVRALCPKATGSSFPILLEILANPDDDKYVRGEVARGLGRYSKSPDVYPALVRILEIEKGEICSSALIGLGCLRDPAGFDLIVEKLHDPELQFIAVIALGELGDTRACTLLVPMLKSEDYSRSLHAATALAKIGCVDSIPALLDFRDRIPSSPIAGAFKTTVEEALRMLSENRQKR
jgi:HEAT repeat protein